MTKGWGARGSRAAAMIIGAVSLVAVAGAAEAADVPVAKEAAAAPAPTSTPIDFAFGGRIASDYNFRGISQSDHHFSPQGYGELQLFDNFFYAGVAGYGVDLPTKPLAEIDLT